MFTYEKRDVGEMGYMARRYETPIDDLEGSRAGFQQLERDFVMAGKIFVYKCDSGRSGVNQRVSLHIGEVTKMERTGDNKMLSL